MKTAVDWLIEMISYSNNDTHSAMYESGFFDQAKELEKEQIINAYESSINTILLLPSGIKSQKGNAEDYYNKTYNN